MSTREWFRVMRGEDFRRNANWQFQLQRLIEHTLSGTSGYAYHCDSTGWMFIGSTFHPVELRETFDRDMIMKRIVLGSGITL